MTGAKYYHALRKTEPAGWWRRRPAWQWALWGAGALVGAGLVGLVVLLLISPGEVTPRGSRSAAGMERQMQGAMMELDAARLAPGLARPDVTVGLSDADLTDYLAQASAHAGLPLTLHDPRLAFGDGTVAAAARAKLWILPVAVTAEITPTASRGRLSVEVPSLRVGLLPVPARYRAKLKNAAQDEINSGLWETKFNLEALEITPGRMTVTLRPPAG